ncbi:MAG: nicotinate-nucleotide adenylyltransferase [Hyphomicrobiales bacterium]|nr:nicotinate-nucleotide adenylyltransferase [Hyphomicrobiales bacterium]MDE2017554.1 nicotinate-nucleotide adenylyltransferase [Hyphomicrobiales bacterium]
MRIGLFGGTFNPPHEGHLHVSREALRRLRLDRLWWLVTPGNPLKDNRALPSLAERIVAARALARDRRIVVTGCEAGLGTRFTADTLRALRGRAPSARFVWIMGADNLGDFPRWRGWRDIADGVPIAVFDRRGGRAKPPSGAAGAYLDRFRLDEADAALLAGAPAPAFVFLHGRRSGESSTHLRGGAP